jgi:phosphoserine aminotransferase
MPRKIFFTPGPSALYYTVEEHIRTALNQQIPEISHRSSVFQSTYQQAEQNLRTLLNLPENFHIAFVSSATEIWERLLQNLVKEHSLHLVNGAFSKRFAEIATELGRRVTIIESSEGQIPDVNSIQSEAEPELIAITQNETSSGVHFPNEEVRKLRGAYPNAILAMDVVSSIPVTPIDYSIVDSVYFSVQKCFGLPAGLGVWIYNDRCLERANHLNEEGISIGSYHSLPKLHASGIKHQTPETPNVLNIYLLSKVAGDMLDKGLDMIIRETNYKSAVLYQMLDAHPNLSPFVEDKLIRSKTVVVANVNGDSQAIIDSLSIKGMVIGTGYGSNKSGQIRIANFPTHSKEQIELLADHIALLH